MPIPLAVPIIAGALSAASPFIGKLFAGKKPTRPDAPDLVAPILAELANRRSELERDLQFRNIRDIEATRASGVNSVVAAGFRNQTVNESNDLRRRIDSIIADKIFEAERQQQLINFDLEQARFVDRTNEYNNRAEAIANIVGSVSSAGLNAFGSGLLGGAGSQGSTGATSLLSANKIGLTANAISPSIFNYQDTGLGTQLNNQLYISGRTQQYTPPSINFPNSLNGGVPKSSLFNFQNSPYQNQFRF